MVSGDDAMVGARVTMVERSRVARGGRLSSQCFLALTADLKKST